MVNSNKAFLRYLYQLKLLRFVIIFFTLLFLLYVALAYTLVPFFLTKEIKEQYWQATGHQLRMGKLEFSPFKYTLSIQAFSDSADLWRAKSIVVDLAFVESIQQLMLVVDEVNLQQFVANPQQLANGQWNFADILTHVDAANKKATAKKSSSASGAPVLIKKFVMSHAVINSNALAFNNLTLAIAPLNITIKTIDLRGKASAPASISLKTNINTLTPLEVKGSINLRTLHAELDVDASAIPVLWFNSLLNTYVALDVLGGSVETHSHISIHNGELKNITSSGAIKNLTLRPANIEQDVVKFKSLAWREAAIALDEKSLHVPLVSLEEFDGQFIIHKDRTNNIQAMLIKPAEPEPSVAPSVTATTAIDSVAAPWKFSVDRMAINNAALGFYDQSLTPSFMVIVQQFSGEITHITNDGLQTMQIALAGNVDGTAPVSLSGKAKFFIEKPQVDVLFSFQKMDMGALSPYSSEYAGWRIKKGLMSVDLHYLYDQGKIVGQNHVVIDHLTFGEKVRSPQMMDIPLRLGLALLTDENGIAVLDAEISGDPQSPSFSLGAVLMRALRNTFVKIITSPFRFLSQLVNSEEDLGRIEFVSGESQLSESAIKKLNLLQQALKKRPSMRLSIQGVYDFNADVKALKAEQLKTVLQKQGVTAEENLNRSAAWEQAVTLYYQTQGLINTRASAAEKFQELAELQIVAQERLDKLAHERALAVKQFFVLQLGIATDRLLLNANLGCAEASKCSSSAVEFALEP